jgi:DNA-binding NtrC family response regulator
MTPIREPSGHQGKDGDRPRPIVVCVDDELPILRSIERLLREEPYQLLTTQNPGEALDWVRTRSVRLVIAEYRMPELTGADLLEAVWADSPNTRRILFTGYPGETMILRGLSRGLYSIVGKPWDDDKLKEAIRKAVGEREEGSDP